MKTERGGKMKQIDPGPDKIFYKGKIVTVDKDFSIEEAVAIKKDRFVAIGSSKEVLALAGSGTERMDLGGKTVVPGFIDTHPHLANAGPRSKGPSLKGLKSIEEIKRLVKGLAGVPLK